jgi:hypothetical protein
MSWVKGDRLKVTLEVTATEPFDEEVTDIWYKAGNGPGHSYIDQCLIEAAGGTVTVEVLPKPVELPTKKWAQVVYKDAFGVEVLATTCLDGFCWHDISGSEVSIDYIRRNYVLTLSEGVDE